MHTICICMTICIAWLYGIVVITSTPIFDSKIWNFAKVAHIPYWPLICAQIDAPAGMHVT